jgi:hypothetical protein
VDPHKYLALLVLFARFFSPSRQSTSFVSNTQVHAIGTERSNSTLPPRPPKLHADIVPGNDNAAGCLLDEFEAAAAAAHEA